MSEMIDRCAAALDEIDIDATTTVDIVLLVIATMREPTESMIYEGEYLTSGYTQGRAKYIYKRMIDEALK